MVSRTLLTCAFCMLPAALFACPVCGLAGSADNTWAYAAMSVVLSAVPLGIIGGIVFWLRKASKQAPDS